MIVASHLTEIITITPHIILSLSLS